MSGTDHVSPSDGAVEWGSWHSLVVGSYAVAVKSAGSATHQHGSLTYRLAPQFRAQSLSVLRCHLLSGLVILIS